MDASDEFCEMGCVPTRRMLQQITNSLSGGLEGMRRAWFNLTQSPRLFSIPRLMASRLKLSSSQVPYCAGRGECSEKLDWQDSDWGIKATPDPLGSSVGRHYSFTNSGIPDNRARALAEDGFYYIGDRQVKCFYCDMFCRVETGVRHCTNCPHRRNSTVRSYEQDCVRHELERTRARSVEPEPPRDCETDLPRPRAWSESRVLGEVGRQVMCSMCGQNTSCQMSGTLHLRRSMDIKKTCSHCGDEIREVCEVCLSSQYFLCQKVECQRMLRT